MLKVVFASSLFVYTNRLVKRGKSPFKPPKQILRIYKKIYFLSKITTRRLIILGREREHQIKFFVNDKELDQIKKKVKKSKLNQSEYLRKCSLEKEIIVVDDLKSVFLELNRQGNNLNQLTRAANQGEINIDTQNLEKELIETWRLLRQLIQKVQ